MTRKIWGICLSVFAVFILTAVFSYWYFGKDTSVPPEEQRGTELVEAVPAKTSPEKVSSTEQNQDQHKTDEDTEGLDGKKDQETYQFVLVNDNNYVAVYQLPDHEIYEYTDVIMDVLPVELQEEIQAGKYLKNEEELYNFLENYTS